MKLDNIQHFERQFNARIRPTSPMRVPEPLYPTWEDSKFESTLKIKSIPAVEITMSQDDFITMTETLDNRSEKNQEWVMFQKISQSQGLGWIDRNLNIVRKLQYEARLRESNPALQKAWEQYQLLLKLTG